MSIRSSMVPQAGGLDTALGFQPMAGDSILYRYNNQTQQYTISEYFEGYGWNPEVPVLNVGESFWIYRGAAGQWSRVFTVW